MLLIIDFVRKEEEQMKKRKITIALLLGLILCLGLASCGKSDDEATDEGTANESYPVKITTYNYAGEEVETTYEKAPEKVIAVYQGSIETMIALGLEDHVVAAYGLDNEVKDEWKTAFNKINYQEEPFAPDKEIVTTQKADMILSWGSIFDEKKLGDVDQWISKGVNTYINTNTRAKGKRTLENEYKDILNIGKIFNVEEKAEKIVDEMKDEVDRVLEESKDKKQLKVAVVEPNGDSITNYGKDSLGGSMVEALGGKLAIPDAATVGKEDLLAADPDIIFVVYMAYSGDDPKTVKKQQLAVIEDDPALKSLSANKNKKVHLIMLGDMYASGPRTIDGLKTFAEGMYPDIDR